MGNSSASVAAMPMVIQAVSEPHSTLAWLLGRFRRWPAEHSSGIPWSGQIAGGKLVAILSLLHQCWCEVPVLFGQCTAATWATAALVAGGANRRPFLIEAAAFLGLLVKLGLDGLDGPRRSEQ